MTPSELRKQVVDMQQRLELLLGVLHTAPNGLNLQLRHESLFDIVEVIPPAPRSNGPWVALVLGPTITTEFYRDGFGDLVKSSPNVDWEAIERWVQQKS